MSSRISQRIRRRRKWRRSANADSPVHRGRAGLRPTLYGPHMRAIDRGAGEVQQVRGPQLGQQHLVQALPDPGIVPVAQPAPARHPRTESQLLGQELPADPGVQHEQDSAQYLAVVQTGSARTSGVALDLRQQRRDPLPQAILDLPGPTRSRRLLLLGWLTPPAPSTKADTHTFPQARHPTFVRSP